MPSFHTAKQAREDARKKIDGGPGDLRVRRGSVEERRSRRRPQGRAQDTVHEIIAEIGKPESSLASSEAGIETERDQERADRPSSLVDRRCRRSGRRLLSSGELSHLQRGDDEYYEEEGSETNGGRGNEAIAGSDDLSDSKDGSGSREERDQRQVMVETNQPTGGNIDVGRIVVTEEVTGDITPQAPFETDEVFVASNEAFEEKTHSGGHEEAFRSFQTPEAPLEEEDQSNTENVIAGETSEQRIHPDEHKEASGKFQTSEGLFETGKQSVAENMAANKISGRGKNFGERESALGNARAREELDEGINNGNVRDESFDISQSSSAISNSKESTGFFTTASPTVKETLGFSLNPTTPGSKGNVRISLSGEIHVNGGLNQTPMLISFDAVPEESPGGTLVKDSSISTVAVDDTVVDLPADRPEFAFDSLASSGRYANDEEHGSSSAASGLGGEFEETDAREVAAKSREKFLDSAQEKRKRASGSSRIQKTSEKVHGNLRTAKQVFVTDYSRTSIAPLNDRIPWRGSDRAIDKLDRRSSVSSVYFPDILGSILVNSTRAG